MLKWVFGADTGPFRQGLAQMRNDVKSFSGSVRGQLASAFGIAALTALGKSALDQAGRFDDLAKRLNTTAESVQRMGYASEQAGGNIEITAKGLTTLTRNLAEAERGSDAFDDSAKVLGLNLLELAKMAPEDQLKEIARGYVEAKDKGQALASVIQLMGKSGAELAPLLSEGPDAFTESMEEAQIATEGQIQMMAKLGDMVDRLKSFGLKTAGTLVTGVQSIGAYASHAVDSLMGFGTEDSRKEKLEKDMNKIMYGDQESTDKKKSAQDAADELEEFERAADARKKLAEEVARLEEDAAMRRLSLEEKITKLKSDERAAEERSYTSGGEDLESRKKELEIAKEIEKLTKEKEDVARRDADDVASKSARLADLSKREAELDKQNRRDAMTDEEKLADMKKEQSHLMKEAAEAQRKGDYETALEKRIEAKGLKGEIRGMEDSRKPIIPTVISDDLRKIGGGGRAVLSTQNPQAGVESRLDVQTQVLRSIEQKLNPSSKPWPL